MTFARYSRALWAETPTNVAKAAKVKREQQVAATSFLLKPAKVDQPPVRVSQTLARLSQTESPESRDSSQLSYFSRPRGNGSEKSVRPALVREWIIGVETLLAMPRPAAYPAACWRSLLDDAGRFVKDWADQAVCLGWQSWEVWGVHPRAPRYRFDAMGLVPMLHRQRITALTADAAVVETLTSSLLRFYRRSPDPLSESERVLIWELT